MKKYFCTITEIALSCFIFFLGFLLSYSVCSANSVGFGYATYTIDYYDNGDYVSSYNGTYSYTITYDDNHNVISYNYHDLVFTHQVSQTSNSTLNVACEFGAYCNYSDGVYTITVPVNSSGAISDFTVEVNDIYVAPTPTVVPTVVPTVAPTVVPTVLPTVVPTSVPTQPLNYDEAYTVDFSYQLYYDNGHAYNNKTYKVQYLYYRQVRNGVSSWYYPDWVVGFQVQNMYVSGIQGSNILTRYTVDCGWVVEFNSNPLNESFNILLSTSEMIVNTPTPSVSVVEPLTFDFIEPSTNQVYKSITWNNDQTKFSVLCLYSNSDHFSYFFDSDYSESMKQYYGFSALDYFPSLLLGSDSTNGHYYYIRISEPYRIGINRYGVYMPNQYYNQMGIVSANVKLVSSLTSTPAYLQFKFGNFTVSNFGNGYNLLNPSLLSSVSGSGITLTVSSDGTFVLNGTPTENIFLPLCVLNLNGSYKLTGTPLGLTSNYSFLYCQESQSFDFGNGVTINYNGSCTFYVAIYAGHTYDNLVFKPMLTTDLTATYNDFVKYEPYTFNAPTENVYRTSSVHQFNFSEFNQEFTYDTPFLNNKYIFSYSSFISDFLDISIRDSGLLHYSFSSISHLSTDENNPTVIYVRVKTDELNPNHYAYDYLQTQFGTDLTVMGNGTILTPQGYGSNPFIYFLSNLFGLSFGFLDLGITFFGTFISLRAIFLLMIFVGVLCLVLKRIFNDNY